MQTKNNLKLLIFIPIFIIFAIIESVYSFVGFEYGVVFTLAGFIIASHTFVKYPFLAFVLGLVVDLVYLTTPFGYFSLIYTLTFLLLSFSKNTTYLFLIKLGLFLFLVGLTSVLFFSLNIFSLLNALLLFLVLNFLTNFLPK